MTVKSYDQKSYDLAEAFLQDEPRLNTEAHRDELAKQIQTSIEDYIQFEQSKLATRPRVGLKAF